MLDVFWKYLQRGGGGFLAWGSCPKGALLGGSDFYPRPIKKYNFSINSNDNIFTIKIYIEF